MKRTVMIMLLFSMPVYMIAMNDDASSVTTSSFSGSSAEMASDDDDDVAAMVIGGADGEVTIDMLMDDHLVGKILSVAERQEIKAHLEGLDETGYRKVIQRLRITRRGRRGHAKQEETVVSVLMALVQEMKEHTAQMQSSGETQQQAYEQQVKSAEFARYKWRNRFWGTIGAAIFSNVIQLAINVWQASTAAENDTNSSSC